MGGAYVAVMAWWIAEVGLRGWESKVLRRRGARAGRVLCESDGTRKLRLLSDWIYHVPYQSESFEAIRNFQYF